MTTTKKKVFIVAIVAKKKGESEKRYNMDMENVFKIENSGPPVRRLIDSEEVMYKMREILPPFEETGEWYENADPKEIMEMVDELYKIVLNQPTIETREVVHAKNGISPAMVTTLIVQAVRMNRRGVK